MKSIFNPLLFLLPAVLFSSCAPILPPTQVPPLVVHYSFATQPWLSILESCAGEIIIAAEQRAVGFQDLETADILLRIGGDTSGDLTFQVGMEELLVIVHPENPVNNLDASQVMGLFTTSIKNWAEVGGTDAPVQVWVYPAGEDIQQLLLNSTLGGSPISTYALLASGLEAMQTAVAGDPHAVGLISRSWLSGDVKEVYSVAEIPVLAILPDGSPDYVLDIVTCLQK